MKTLAFILCMIALPAMAQWPSLSKPMPSYDRGNEALSSAVERLTVSIGPQAWTNYITTNIWASYFSNASKLKASKAMLRSAINGVTWVRPTTNYTPETVATVTESNVLAWCGAPAGWWTNHPYVNLAGSSNGWRFLPDVASNVVWIKRTVEWSPWVITNELPVFNVWWDYAIEDFGPDKLLSLLPRYYYGRDHSVYVWGVLGLNPPVTYVAWAHENNARASWTTLANNDTWPTNVDIAFSGYTNSILTTTNLGGFNWSIPMNPYPTWTPPMEVGSFSRHRIGYSIVTNTTGTNAVAVTTNAVEDYEMRWVTNEVPYDIIEITNTPTTITVTNYIVIGSNYVEVTSNYTVVVSTNVNVPTNKLIEADSIEMFAGEFAGSRASFRGWFNWIATNSVATNMPVDMTTNVFVLMPDYWADVYDTNVIIAVTNIIGIGYSNKIDQQLFVITNYVPETNYIFCPTSSVIATNNGTLKYTCGAVTMGSYPYIRSYDRVSDDVSQDGWPVNETSVFERVIDFWIERKHNTNVICPEVSSNWNGFNISAPVGYTNYIVYGGSFGGASEEYVQVVSDAGYASHPYVPKKDWNAGVPWAMATSTFTTVSGCYVGGSRSGDADLDWHTDTYMTDYNNITNVAYYVKEGYDALLTYPTIPNLTWLHGWQIDRSCAIERFNATTNGFKWFK